MGCGASAAAPPAGSVEPRPEPEPAGPTYPDPERLERQFGALTEAELEASGFMERAEGGKAYLGLHGTFYQLAPETEAERQVAVAALAREAHGPTEHSKVNAALLVAKAHFCALDTERGGSLSAQELEPLCGWLFDQCARSFATEGERAQAMEKQMRSFHKNAPTADGEWTFRQFEAYHRRTIEEAEAVQLQRNQAYARDYDRVAAAIKFSECDRDHSQFLEGAEAAEYAEWLVAKLLHKGEGGLWPPSQAHKEEAAALLKRLDGAKSGSYSFAQFDGYFATRIHDVKAIKVSIKERWRFLQDASAARIQAMARGKKGREIAAERREAKRIADSLGLTGSDDELAAISRIQAIFRGKIARRLLIKENAAAVIIQAVTRLYRVECWMDAQNNAALLIQSYRRGKSERKKAQERREAKLAKEEAIEAAKKKAAAMAAERAAREEEEARRVAEEEAAKRAAEESRIETVMLRVWAQEDRLNMPRSATPETVELAVERLKEADTNAVLCALVTACPLDRSREVSMTGAALQYLISGAEPLGYDGATHMRELEAAKLLQRDHLDEHGHTAWSLTVQGRIVAAALPRVQEWEEAAEQAAAERTAAVEKAMEMLAPDLRSKGILVCACRQPCLCSRKGRKSFSEVSEGLQVAEVEQLREAIAAAEAQAAADEERRRQEEVKRQRDLIEWQRQANRMVPSRPRTAVETAMATEIRHIMSMSAA